MKSNLGTFKGFNKRQDKMLEQPVTAEEVISWDHFTDGVVEFLPVGDRPELNCLVGMFGEITPNLLIKIDALLRALGGDTLRNFLALYHATGTAQCRIHEIGFEEALAGAKLARVEADPSAPIQPQFTAVSEALKKEFEQKRRERPGQPRKSVNLGTFRMIKRVGKAGFETGLILDEDEWSTGEVLAMTGKDAACLFEPIGDCEEICCLDPDAAFTHQELTTLRDILAGYEFDRREAFLRIHYSMAKLKKGVEELTLESVRDCTKDVWFGELDDVSVPDMFERFVDQNPEAYIEGYVSTDEEED